MNRRPNFSFPSTLTIDSTTSGAPRWLDGFLNNSKYRKTVLDELSLREKARAQFRNGAWFPQMLHISRKGFQPTVAIPSLTSKKEPSPEELLAEHYATSEAQAGENIGSNRYNDVLPYDRHAVFVNHASSSLDPATSQNESGAYLNASWVKETAGEFWWIAAQAPLPNTIPTFLTLCSTLTPFEKRPKIIVQLTAHVEAGRRKAHEYLPKTIGPSGRIRYRLPTADRGFETYLEVELLDQTELAKAGTVQSSLEIKVLQAKPTTSAGGPWSIEQLGPPTRVTHCYYEAWPDFGVPEDPDSILELAKVIEQLNGRAKGNVDDASDRAPVLVHCSAGVGRTGTFIAISSALRQCGVFGSRQVWAETPTGQSRSPLGPLSKALQGDLIAQEIDHLREYRCMMVQRPEQVAFVYTVVGRALGIS